MSSKAKDRKPVTAMIWDKLSDPIITNLGVFSRESAKSVAKIDGQRVSTNPKQYSNDNWVTYYLVVNTWLLQARELSERGCLELHEAIIKKGLLACIAECDGVANRYVASMADNASNEGLDIPDYLIQLLSSCENDKVALQILRYPKRFSPDGADLVEEASVDMLLAINQRCRDVNRAGYEGWASYKPNWKSYTPSRYWIDRIRACLGDMLKGYSCDFTDGIFSTGVAADAGRPLAEKLVAYATWECCLYKSPLYPISAKERYLWEERTPWNPLHCAYVQAVPKSYKAARIIAEEHAYRQYHMQAIRREIENVIMRNGYLDYLDLHSQVRNQEYAHIGSRSGVYATIDLSSASDSLARSLAYEVLPDDLVSDVDMYLPRYFKVRNCMRLMHMFCTSGSAVTFPVESIVFLAIALAIRETTTALTGEFYLPPVVFGDDIVVDVLLYDTVVDVLEQLGFVVNTSKSYGPGTKYRESCGCEYICGYDLKSSYWPRTTLRWTRKDLPTVVAQICALQHKLYGNYYIRKFLSSFVRCIEPRMTSHLPGTECADLWESIPVYKVKHAPGLEACTDPRALREVHLTLKTRYYESELEWAEMFTGLKGQNILEMWRYSTFLRSGPTYNSELERLLGVSSKQAPLSHDMTVGDTFWGFLVE
jgi:hypothetical protein